MLRRSFLKNTAALSAAALTARFALSSAQAADIASGKIPVSSVSGADPFKNTHKALELLGGMQRFVKPGSTVGLLVNAPPWWKRPGSHTSTEVVLATAKMAQEAGAKRIVFLIKLASDFWGRSKLSLDHKELVASIVNPSDKYVEREIPKGLVLKKAKLIQDLFDCDTFSRNKILGFRNSRIQTKAHAVSRGGHGDSRRRRRAS
jgi:hypothetical protein